MTRSDAFYAALLALAVLVFLGQAYRAVVTF